MVKRSVFFLQVLVHTGVVELPACLVMQRWTVSAREGAVCSVAGHTSAAETQADAANMHGLLHSAAMELVCMGTQSRQAFEVAVDFVSNAKAAISSMTVSDPIDTNRNVQTALDADLGVLHFDPSIAAPPRVRSRGRPKELRFKSPIESPGAKKGSSSGLPKTVGSEKDHRRKSTRFLKTGAYIMEHCESCGSTQHQSSECRVNDVTETYSAAKRRCKSCGETGHNRSTCGRKSSYVPK
jgi:hypothetical protein